MSVMEKIAEFLGHLARHAQQHGSELRETRQDQRDMAASLQTIKAAVLAQGVSIDTLVAAKTTAKQADFDAIEKAIEANGVKLSAALAPESSTGGGDTGSDAGTPSTVTTAGPAQAGSTVIPVTAHGAPAVGGTVAGPGVPAGTTVQAGSTDATLVLSQGLASDHVGGETLTHSPAAQAAV